MEYREYLKSSVWKSKANARAKIDGYRCVMCGCNGTPENPLEVHHLNYKSLYHEDIETDLVTLCHSCHSSIHRLMNRVTDSRTGRHGWTDSLPPDVVHVLNVSQDGARQFVTEPGKGEKAIEKC